MVGRSLTLKYTRTVKLYRTFVAATVALVSSGAAFLGSAAYSEDGEWNVTLLGHVNSATDAYNSQDWNTAKREYLKSIALYPKDEEFYDGLMNTCLNIKDWPNVALAAQKIAELDPPRRGEVAYDYAVALYQMNRYDDAVPWLKTALQSADRSRSEFHPTRKDEKKIRDSHPDNHPAAPPVYILPPKIDHTTVTLDPKGYLTFDHMLFQCEFVGLATFEGLERGKGEISWNEPPIAKFHLYNILKGPPLNPSIVVRYEFHDYLNKTMPKDWKWDEKSLPEKGSKWVICIPEAAAHRGAYETYQGSYGRQPANDQNLTDVYAILDKYNMRNTNKIQ
jgi:tetratricopeptide (TPR) repeat protein